MDDSATLRTVAFDRRFLEESRNWFADAELRELTATPPVDTKRQENWFASLPLPGYYLWGILHNEIPAGVFGIKNIEARIGEYWGYIGTKKLWGVGIGRWMMQTALDEARCLGLRGLRLRVLPTNERAIALYRKFNFQNVPGSQNDGFLHLEVIFIDVSV